MKEPKREREMNRKRTSAWIELAKVFFFHSKYLLLNMAQCYARTLANIISISQIRPFFDDHQCVLVNRLTDRPTDCGCVKETENKHVHTLCLCINTFIFRSGNKCLRAQFLRIQTIFGFIVNWLWIFRNEFVWSKSSVPLIEIDWPKA